VFTKKVYIINKNNFCYVLPIWPQAAMDVFAKLWYNTGYQECNQP